MPRCRLARKEFPGQQSLGFKRAEVLGNEIAGLIMVTRTSGKTFAWLPADFRKRVCLVAGGLIWP
jgi:hypothetical protein